MINNTKAIKNIVSRIAKGDMSVCERPEMGDAGQFFRLFIYTET